MYCSIDDAWGSDFNRDSKNIDSDKSEEFRQREYKMLESSEDNTESQNNTERQEYAQYMKLKERFGEGEHEDKVCIAVNTHINKCPICRAKYLNAQKSALKSPLPSLPSLSTFVDKFHENSDAITVLLICIMIILMVKLFKS